MATVARTSNLLCSRHNNRHALTNTNTDMERVGAIPQVGVSTPV
jgi:hypothetical protein